MCKTTISALKRKCLTLTFKGVEYVKGKEYDAQAARIAELEKALLRFSHCKMLKKCWSCSGLITRLLTGGGE